MEILVINAGSSSLKFQLLNSEDGSVLAKGICERIGIDGAIQYTPGEGEKLRKSFPMPTHREAIKEVLRILTSENVGVIKSIDEIDAVGHRVVHGGEKFSESAVITPEVQDAIHDCVPLAPLHNPANLTGIEACMEAMPDKPMVAVFDTAFHQTMPPEAYMYALPYHLYKDLAIRRYGFHGTSHSFVAKKAADFVGKDIKDLKIVTCHLGNGSSLAAVKGGVSVDTSMGMTPVAGVPMGTRCGDIDPAILKYLKENDDTFTFKVADRIMNKESGVFGISGVSSDFRDINDAMNQGNKRAKLALDLFCYQVRKYIGAYAAAMDGVDVIVFTAGVGENDGYVREQIVNKLNYLGLELDSERNKQRGDAFEITSDSSKVKVLVLATNEELVIAQETARLV